MRTERCPVLIDRTAAGRQAVTGNRGSTGTCCEVTFCGLLGKSTNRRRGIGLVRPVKWGRHRGSR